MMPVEVCVFRSFVVIGGGVSVSQHWHTGRKRNREWLAARLGDPVGSFRGGRDGPSHSHSRCRPTAAAAFSTCSAVTNPPSLLYSTPPSTLLMQSDKTS